MAETPKPTPEELRRTVGIDAPEEAKSKVEKIKLASHGLRGEIATDIDNPEKGDVSGDSLQLLKHFGMYQQDDRDLRIERKRAGLDKDFSFMVRTKVPGGRLTADQWLVMDECADAFAKGSIRLTTRQTIQFHGIGKDRLRGLSRALNEKLLTSYGACGDVVRNVMSCPVIDLDPRPEWAGRDVFGELSRQISDRTLPRTNAFYDIFIDGEKDNTGVPTFELRSEAEDLYGTSFMPRKFKIGITIPQDNCVDIYTQDLGLVAIVEGGLVRGYNVLVGGGLGHSHGNKKTYPRAASEVAFVPAGEVLRAVDAVVTIQRDYGNRVDRKQARLKYLVDNVGIEWFHEEMERRMGLALDAPVAIPDDQWKYDDHLGWHEQHQPGLCYVGVFVENGRLVDGPRGAQRSAVREIVRRFRPEVRISGQQNLILAHVAENHRDEIEAILRDAHLPTAVNGALSTLRRHEIACVALPTCGLALAEAERAMPQLMDKLEDMGYGGERIQIRMSGCPNSCSRPPAAEIGIIGVAPGKYNVYTGGDFEGTRINQLLKEKVPFEELPVEIGRLIDRWREERQAGEAFGDWSHRLGVEALLN